MGHDAEAPHLNPVFRLFPDDETCLTHLLNVRFGQGFTCPSCERPSKWFRIKAERAYRRDHLRALAQRVEVDKGEVRIMGSKTNLLRTLTAGVSGTVSGSVPSFVPNWRSGR